LEYALAAIDRTNNYHNVQCNAMFMLALGLGIHPRHAYTLSLVDIARIRQLLRALNCYTQWAWTYIDKLVTNRGFHLPKGRYVPQLFITYATGTPIDLAMAHGIAGRWKDLYSLTAREAILAHRTMAVEFAGNRRTINALYKEIFTANEKHPGRYQVAPEAIPGPAPVTPIPTGAIAHARTPTLDSLAAYWAGGSRFDNSTGTPVKKPLPVLYIHRNLVRRHYLDARRHYDHRQYVSSHSAESINNDTI